MKLMVAGFAAPGGIGCTLLQSPGPIRPGMYCAHILQRLNATAPPK
jgi:hypothetical protein